METIYIPDGEYVAYIKSLMADGNAELTNVDGKNRWVCEIDGIKKIVRPESAKSNE